MSKKHNRRRMGIIPSDYVSICQNNMNTPGFEGLDIWQHMPQSWHSGRPQPEFSTRGIRRNVERHQAKLKAKRAKEKKRNEKTKPICKGASSADVAPQKNPPKEGE